MMVENKKFYGFLESERLYLRAVQPDDANEAYYRWMNDPAVNKYLESRFYPHTLETLKDYIQSKLGDNENPFFAIILKDSNRHIGNIKLGPINTIHRFADIGIIIGEKDCWGKGYATEAIRLVVKYAFDTLNLHKVTAGFYEPNIQSMKAFIKAGFIQEGIRKSHCYCDGKYVDDILVGLTRTE
jgi:[ribosomal protein S5]-alanine N-acetyltransferase